MAQPLRQFHAVSRERCRYRMTVPKTLLNEDEKNKPARRSRRKVGDNDRPLSSRENNILLEQENIF